MKFFLNVVYLFQTWHSQSETVSKLACATHKHSKLSFSYFEVQRTLVTDVSHFAAETSLSDLWLLFTLDAFIRCFRLSTIIWFLFIIMIFLCLILFCFFRFFLYLSLLLSTEQMKTTKRLNIWSVLKMSKIELNKIFFFYFLHVLVKKNDELIYQYAQESFSINSVNKNLHFHWPLLDGNWIVSIKILFYYWIGLYKKNVCVKSAYIYFWIGQESSMYLLSEVSK